MRFTFLLMILLSSSHVLPAADCPINQKDLLINTQEKYDNIYLQYPDCDDFNIVMYNGKFIGDPRTGLYVILLLGMIVFILIGLKWLFNYAIWFDQ